MSLTNLLEWLTELREIFCLLDYWFIIEGNNSETDTRDAYHKVWGKDRASMPSQALPSPAPPQINQPGVFLNLVLLGFYGGFITKV